MKSIRRIFAAILAVLILCCFAGCGAKAEAENGSVLDRYDTGGTSDIYYGSVMDMEGVVEVPSQNSTASAPQVNAQKLIRTFSIQAETNDMDALLSQLDGKIRALGGYVESRSVSNGSASATRRYRYANLTIRIPVDQLDSFAEHIKGESNVVSFMENAEDITLSYVATQSRIVALQTEETRLLELMAKAENMSDLLQIQQRLTDVRTELEQVTSQLRLYDNLVDYGTIELNVTEVQEYTPVEKETVWQRIGSGLADNWDSLCVFGENLLVFLITSVPFLIPLGAAAGVTVVVVKLATRKKTGKEPPKQEDKE